MTTVHPERKKKSRYYDWSSITCDGPVDYLYEYCTVQLRAGIRQGIRVCMLFKLGQIWLRIRSRNDVRPGTLAELSCGYESILDRRPENWRSRITMRSCSIAWTVLENLGVILHHPSPFDNHSTSPFSLSTTHGGIDWLLNFYHGHQWLYECNKDKKHSSPSTLPWSSPSSYQSSRVYKYNCLVQVMFIPCTSIVCVCITKHTITRQHDVAAELRSW